MSLGSLYKLDPTYRYNQKMQRLEYEQRNHLLLDKEEDNDPLIPETVQQKRKRLFNKDTGSLNLSFKGIPFWLWGDQLLHEMYRRKTGGMCCFVDILGRPRNPKTGKKNPMFPYEMEVYRSMFENDYANSLQDKKKWKHIWIKKAAGAGITEFFIYMFLYLPLAFPDEFYDSQIAIVTGINANLAKGIMRRMKNKLYQRLHLTFDFNERVIDVNGCIIQAYPSKNPDAYRALHNLKGIFCDEADFFDPNNIENVRDAIERYYAKSNPWIIVNSTANEPDGFMERIEKQDEETCFYKRLFILAPKLKGYIYTKEELDLMSQSDSYPREYLGEYHGLRGNVFKKEYLDFAIGETDTINILDKNTGAIKRTIVRNKGELTVKEVISDYRYLGQSYKTSIGEDPAFSSSQFGIVVNKLIGNVVYAVKELGLDAPTHEEGIEVTKDLMFTEYPYMHPKIYVDASQVAYIRALKKELNEDENYHKYSIPELIERIKRPTGMKVCPIAFNKFGDRMLYQWKRFMELGLYRLDPDITPNLYISMSSAKYDENKNRFDKNKTALNDYFDGGRLALCNWTLDGSTPLTA